MPSKKLKITLTRSMIGLSPRQEATVKSLGLRRMRHQVTHDDFDQLIADILDGRVRLADDRDLVRRLHPENDLGISLGRSAHRVTSGQTRIVKLLASPQSAGPPTSRDRFSRAVQKACRGRLGPVALWSQAACRVDLSSSAGPRHRLAVAPGQARRRRSRA